MIRDVRRASGCSSGANPAFVRSSGSSKEEEPDGHPDDEGCEPANKINRKEW